jgi:hypothetical protein
MFKVIVKIFSSIFKFHIFQTHAEHIFGIFRNARKKTWVDLSSSVDLIIEYCCENKTIKYLKIGPSLFYKFFKIWLFILFRLSYLYIPSNYFFNTCCKEICESNNTKSNLKKYKIIRNINNFNYFEHFF